jgi:hypothetical protein
MIFVDWCQQQYHLDNLSLPVKLVNVRAHYIINTVIAEPEVSTPLVPKSAVGHDPESFLPPPILTNYSYFSYVT